MPDEDDNVKIDEDELPETPLHAHSSGTEDTGVEGQDQGEEPEGGVHEGEPDASEVPKTGGATSGGPPQEDASEDPSHT